MTEADTAVRAALAGLTEAAHKDIILKLSRSATKTLARWIESAHLGGSFRATHARRWLDSRQTARLMEHLLKPGSRNLREAVVFRFAAESGLAGYLMGVAKELPKEGADNAAAIASALAGQCPANLAPLYSAVILGYAQGAAGQANGGDGPGDADGPADAALETAPADTGLDEMDGLLQALDTHEACAAEVEAWWEELRLARPVDAGEVAAAVEQCVAAADELRRELAAAAAVLGEPVPDWGTACELRRGAESLASRVKELQACSGLILALAAYLGRLSFDHRSAQRRDWLTQTAAEAALQLRAAADKPPIVLAGPATTAGEWLAWALSVANDELMKLTLSLQSISPALAALVENCEAAWVHEGQPAVAEADPNQGGATLAPGVAVGSNAAASAGAPDPAPGPPGPPGPPGAIAAAVATGDEPANHPVEAVSSTPAAAGDERAGREEPQPEVTAAPPHPAPAAEPPAPQAHESAATLAAAPPSTSDPATGTGLEPSTSAAAVPAVETAAEATGGPVDIPAAPLATDSPMAQPAVPESSAILVPLPVETDTIAGPVTQSTARESGTADPPGGTGVGLSSDPLAAARHAGVEDAEPATCRPTPTKGAGVEAAPPRMTTDLRVLAPTLSTASPGSSWDPFLWSLVGAGELAAAYWVARSSEAAAEALSIPSWALLAGLGVDGLAGNTDRVTADLMELALTHTPPATGPLATLCASTAAVGALVAPSCGLLSWFAGFTNRELDCGPYVTALSEFAQQGLALQAADLASFHGERAHAEAVAAACDEARRWLEQSEQRALMARVATLVWQRLTGRDGAVWRLLDPVRRNDAVRIDEVQARIRELSDRQGLVRLVDELTRDVRRPRFEQIVAVPLEQIIRGVRDATSLARQWVDLNRRGPHAQLAADWPHQQAHRLRDSLAAVVPALDARVAEILDHPTDVRVWGATAAFARSLKRLCSMVAIDVSSARALPTNGLGSPVPPQAATLEGLASEWLIWLPELPLAPGPAVPPQWLPGLRHLITGLYADPLDRADLIHRWMDTHDYQFAAAIAETLPEVEAGVRRGEIAEAIDGSRRALVDNLVHTRTVVERAVIDGVVADRPELSGRITAVAESDGLDYRHREAELAAIRQAVEDARRQRVTSLTARWQAHQAAHPMLGAGVDNTQAVPFVDEALRRGDVRAVEECLSRLEGGEGFETIAAMGRASTGRDVLGEYMRCADTVREWLAATLGAKGILRALQGQVRPPADLRFDDLTQQRREEAVAVATEWDRAKRRRAVGADLDGLLAAVARFLGLSVVDDGNLRVQVLQRNQDCVHARVALSASDLARPIAQFGSLSHGAFHFLCLWERPGADTVAARVAEMRLESHSVVVLYLGPLTLKQRTALGRRARSRKLALAAMDETLFAFLCAERDARYRAFLQAALPFAAVNPYTPTRQGDIPPEVFYGRSRMVKTIVQGDSSVIYGGRQLGKSALLRHVCRSYHDPRLSRFSWVEDIKLLGVGEQPPSDLWLRLREGLKDVGVLPRRERAVRPEEIQNLIISSVTAQSQRQVLVLLDEADNFLNADGANHFQVVEGLRSVMVSTERRFRVVLAGLHNVQRFQGIQNHPLAHFGTPLCVDPLDPDAAEGLVREPFTVLGYRFADPGAVLSVLSYTNYHPGLVQLFCHKMLDRLIDDNPNADPPYVITQQDIERQYMDIRGEIRLRLDLTLGLDLRYQAIAYSVAFDQLDSGGAYNQSYAEGELLAMAQANWPRGFNRVPRDEFKGLLNEMCGLGVLSRCIDGRYRLRSPNLVTLMGTAEEIHERLVDLTEQDPTPAFKADSHHAPLDGATRQYSPFTLSQERRLFQRRFGCCLVFGSDALGAADVPAALESVARRSVNAGIPCLARAVPPAPIAAGAVDAWLDELLRSHDDEQQLLVYARLDEPPSVVTAACQAAAEFCRRHAAAYRRWLRVVWVLGPAGCHAWARLAPDQRTALMERMDAAVQLRPWDLYAVQQRLEQCGMFSHTEVCSVVHEATGGWPDLLDRVLTLCSDTDEPRPAARRLAAALSVEGARERQQFLDLSGVTSDRAVRPLLLAAREAQGLPVDMLSSDLIPCGDSVGDQRLQAAAVACELMGLATVNDGVLTADPFIQHLLG